LYIIIAAVTALKIYIKRGKVMKNIFYDHFSYFDKIEKKTLNDYYELIAKTGLDCEIYGFGAVFTENNINAETAENLKFLAGLNNKNRFNYLVTLLNDFHGALYFSDENRKPEAKELAKTVNYSIVRSAVKNDLYFDIYKRKFNKKPAYIMIIRKNHDYFDYEKELTEEQNSYRKYYFDILKSENDENSELYKEFKENDFNFYFCNGYKEFKEKFDCPEKFIDFHKNDIKENLKFAESCYKLDFKALFENIDKYPKPYSYKIN
jgi:hypothetical protein